MNGYSKEERKEFIPTVYDNTIKNMKTLIEAAAEHNWTVEDKVSIFVVVVQKWSSETFLLQESAKIVENFKDRALSPRIPSSFVMSQLYCRDSESY
jgi:hypothetical protein